MLFRFIIFYCICELLENRFLQMVAARPKSDFDLSLKNESLMLELLLDTCVNKKGDNNVLLIVENANHCASFKYLFLRNTPIHLFQSNINFDSRRGFQETYLSNETQIAKYHKPTSCAIIIMSNIAEFTKLMLEMKNSIWWQHEAYFVIVNIDYINSCQFAHAFISKAWSFNILSVIYICKNLNDQEEAYTFNPYAPIAPKFWTRVDADNNPLFSSLSFFQLSLRLVIKLSNRGKLTCHNLFFDKTKNLRGTNLKVVLKKSGALRYDLTKTGYKRFTSPSFLVIASILNYVNATITVKFSGTFGHINDFGEPQESLKDILSGTVSIGLNQRFLQYHWKFQAYSFSADSVAIATLKKRITSIEKLGKLSSTFFIYLFIVSLSFTATLKYILKQSMSSAALNYMRICQGNSSLTVPQNAARRILLILFIIVAFVFNSCVLSYLTAMESSSNMIPVIDTYDDLIKSDLVIRGSRTFKELIWQNEIKDHLDAVVDRGTNDCFDVLWKRNSSIACVATRFAMGYYVRESQLFHISKYNLVDRGKSYLFAEDFPLFSKIQSLLLEMSEGGFIELIFAREAFYRHARFSESRTVEGVKLENIYYFFTVLIGGWVLGLLVLFVEVAAFKLKAFTLKLYKWRRFTYFRLTKWLSNSEKK